MYRSIFVFAYFSSSFNLICHMKVIEVRFTWNQSKLQIFWYGYCCLSADKPKCNSHFGFWVNNKNKTTTSIDVIRVSFRLILNTFPVISRWYFSFNIDYVTVCCKHIRNNKQQDKHLINILIKVPLQHLILTWNLIPVKHVVYCWTWIAPLCLFNSYFPYYNNR